MVGTSVMWVKVLQEMRPMVFEVVFDVGYR